MMTQADPAQPSRAAPIVLPRPNLGPEPWSAPEPAWTPLEVGIVGGVAVLVAALAILKRRRARASDRGEPAGEVDPDAADLSPSRRLIA